MIRVKKILTKFISYNLNVFSESYDNQLKYIDKITDIKSDFDRSYYQYKCQCRYMNWIIMILLNIVSLPLMIFFLLKCNANIKRYKSSDAIIFLDGKSFEIVPESILKSYKKYHIINDDTSIMNGFLSSNDRKFFFEIVRYVPFQFYFLLKCLLHIRKYSYYINTFAPECLIVCTEYSFTSSIITLYCERNGVKHINVMHGEKLFFMRDSFFRYTKCYVWDFEYVNLFVDLKAYSPQFIVEVPPLLKNHSANVKKVIDYTYYLGGEKRNDIVKIVAVLKKLSEKYVVALRPHPRYTDIKIENSSLIVEDNELISIDESVSRCKNVISLYSTVLNQAYNLGIPIVIDDVTQSCKYEKLRKLRYIMLKKQHKLLSEVIKGG